MCSRNTRKQTNLMDNPRIGKPKTIQMTYPAPYSKSWSGPTVLNNRNKTKKTFTPSKGSAQLPVRRDNRPQLKCRGPDPTLPHLKYGLFPKKTTRGQSHVLSSKTPQTPHVQESDFPDLNKPKIRTPKEGDSSTPYFMVRSLETHLTRHLSRAASTHLDIKPRNV